MKQLEGVVTSVKMTGTVTVVVERRKKHPLYGKSVRRMKKYHAACYQEVKEGDKVKMIEVKPVSKMKKWRITEVRRGF